MGIIEKSKKNPRKAASQFLHPVSINLKKLPQMPASRFLKYTGRKWPNPVCSFYLPVSTSRDDPVPTGPNLHLIVQGLVQDLNVYKTHGTWFSQWNLTSTDAMGFSFFTTTNDQMSTGITYMDSIFSRHNIKGLLFPNQTRLGPLPKKARTPSESDTSPSASSHMDASHSSREINMPDSEVTRLGAPSLEGVSSLKKIAPPYWVTGQTSTTNRICSREKMTHAQYGC